MTATLDTILAALANSFWASAAIVLVAWAAMRYAPRMNAATRHLVWWAVLAVIVAMPAGSWIAKARLARNPETSQTIAAAASEPDPPSTSKETTAPILTAAPPARGGLEIPSGPWPLLALALWAAVFAGQLGRIAWSYRHLRGIKRRARRADPETRRDFDVWMLACGVHRPAQLLISREIVSPMALGFRTPAVILPEGLLPEFQDNELDHVLLHELAHIARRDDWSNLAARIGWAFLALHPAAAWVLRQIEREREIACDDWVVTATGEARPYAASLARLFEICFTRRRALLATGMAERASLLGDRIEMLLRRQREFTSRVSLVRVAVCAAVLVVLLAAGSQAPQWISFAQDQAIEPAVPLTPPELPAAPTPVAVPASPTSPSPDAAPAPPALAAAPQRSPAPAASQQNASPTPPAIPRNGSFLAALVAAGYGDLPVDDIIALKDNGIDAGFLTGVIRSGWGKLSPQDLIALHNHGVSPDFLRQVHDSGITGLKPRDVIDLHDNGLNGSYLHDIQAAGLGTYSIRDVIQFHQHGVRPELLRALKDAGFHNVEAADVMQLQDNGVGSRNLQEARQYGSSLTLKQIIRLKQAGVI